MSRPSSSPGRILAVVPARRGSKSIADKNVAVVGGRPLMVHTLTAALEALSPDRVIVSTDSPEYAEVARQTGAEVPFLRPAELAQDDTPSAEPVLHALAWLEEHERYVPDAVMLLQPTSPLRTAADVDAASELFARTGAPAVVSVGPAASHPYLVVTLDGAGRLTWLMPEGRARRRQERTPVYALNGAVYLVRRDVLVAQRTFVPDGAQAYVMPPERSVDVDEPFDLRVVDLLLTHGSVGPAPAPAR